MQSLSVSIKPHFLWQRPRAYYRTVFGPSGFASQTTFDQEWSSRAECGRYPRENRFSSLPCFSFSIVFGFSCRFSLAVTLSAWNIASGASLRRTVIDGFLLIPRLVETWRILLSLTSCTQGWRVSDLPFFLSPMVSAPLINLSTMVLILGLVHILLINM